MSLSEELDRLAALHERGMLSDDEFARATGIESWIWRLLFAALGFCAGTGVLVYLLMWFLIPADPLTPGRAPGHPQAG